VARDVEQVQAGPTGAAQDGGSPRRRSLRDRLQLWALVELFVLCGFAIAQPLLDVTGRSPEFFLFRRADRLDIVAVALGLLLLPALGIWTAEVLTGLVSERARRYLHLAAVAGLVALVAIQVAKKLTGLRGPVVVAVALVVGALATVIYARASWPRLWLRYLTPAPLVFALVFLLLSPSSRLVLPARAEASAGPAPAAAAGRQPPLVMILFDEFPLSSLLDHTGRIDRRVYPNFAAFADRSTWYRNATGISGYTPWAMPAMLTGRYPSAAKAPSWTEYPDNLFTLFGRYYDLRVYETISQLCPPQRCRFSDGHLDQAGLGAVLAETARSYRKLISPYDAAEDPASFADQTDAEAGRPLRPTFRFDRLRLNQPSRFNDFLDGLRASDRPTMHVLHLLLPHPPWRYLPSGTEYNDKSFAVAHKTEQAPLRWSSWTTSATCSRSPIPTGCSGRWWTSSRPRACGTRRWWCWAPTTAGAGCLVSSPATCPPAMRPTCCGFPSSSSSPASAAAGSTTATGNRSTCCRPSPTWSASRSPGGWTGCRRPDHRRADAARSGSTTSPAAGRFATARPTSPGCWPA
jgi:hypothetical protein